ncbi:3-ketoacyl-CoA thiolase [compost metagenome]
MTGIPVMNVNNNCATGSSALFLARQAVQSGAVDCALAVGFEEMGAGALKSVWTDRPRATERAGKLANELIGRPDLPGAIRQFAGAGQAHMQKYGTRLETFASIRAKASRHAANNPLAVFRNVLTTEDVMAAPMLWDGVMTRLMACPPTCGAAAAIVVSERFARKHGLRTDVLIAGQSVTTDTPSSFETRDMIRVVGFDMTRAAAAQAYEQAGVGPADVDVIELHDCFAQNELLSYEGLGLCGEGGAEKLVNDGDNTYGGKWVVNPSGGLLSKGHPLGATGLAQCYELTQQLRGTAAQRQVDGARVALAHNVGLGGACVVTIYQAA